MGWLRRAEYRNFALSDPAFASWLGLTPTGAGVPVTESTSLGLTAVWRAVTLISAAAASMSLDTFRRVDETSKVKLSSFLDDPAGSSPIPLTPFQWVETVTAHILLHGNAYLAHVYGGAGQIVGLSPLHPGSVSVEWHQHRPGEKLYRVSFADGSQGEFTTVDLTQIMGLSTDGLRGYSPIAVARHAIGTGIAGGRNAAATFASGATISGIVTPEDGEDLTEDEARTIKSSLRAKLTGPENAGDIAVLNRRLKFAPWSFSAVDAQFIESRQFSVAEISRLYGVPRELLSEAGATSWGTGIQELVRGFLKFTLDPLLRRIESQLSTLLPSPRFVEFNRKQLLQGSPSEEIDLLLKQVNGGLLSVNEARGKMNLPPVASGDTLRLPPGSNPPEEGTPEPEVVDVDA
ncbi:MAG: phage portal protein [bacterium]